MFFPVFFPTENGRSHHSQWVWENIFIGEWKFLQKLSQYILYLYPLSANIYFCLYCYKDSIILLWSCKLLLGGEVAWEESGGRGVVWRGHRCWRGWSDGVWRGGQGERGRRPSREWVCSCLSIQYSHVHGFFPLIYRWYFINQLFLLVKFFLFCRYSKVRVTSQ